MKGMVFTEFIEFVEQQFSLELVDKIIEESHLATGGAYTSVGTYDHKEMVKLVQSLSKELNVPIPDLLQTFGKHLFYRFKALFPQLFIDKTDTFSFLESVENYIHVEVRKLYRDAELPRFEYAKPDNDTLIMVYSSARHFGDLAEGLIRGCIEVHGENIEVKRESLPAAVSGESKVRFVLTKQ